jgi:outer membrane protein OmpA-like peptidoglycan-associated protein
MPAPAASDANTAAPQAAPPPAPEPLPWALTHRAYNTFEGSTGSMFIVDPGMAQPGAVRLQLGLDTFSGSDFLYKGDSVDQDRQFISASWTALEYLEIYGSVQNRATFADKPAQNSLHALGDSAIGAKFGKSVEKIWRFGGDARFLVQNNVGDKGTLLDATSIGLRGSAALDLQGLPQPVPFIARLNADYYFDNSAKVLSDTENLRYSRLTNPLPKINETRNLVTRVERFGLGVNRVDMVTLGVGVEVPLALAKDFYLYPMADWRLGLPVNRQGYNCAYHSKDTTRGTNAPGADDTCLNDAGFDAWPMLLAVGARVAPPVRGLSVLLGVDIALKGSSTFVRELAPPPPFRVLIALGYDYDAQPPPPPPPPPPAPPPPPPLGTVLGQINDQTSGQAIAGAIARLVGSERSALASDATGRFVVPGLPPGEVEVELSHPEYESRRCATSVPVSGGEVVLTCTMTALPTGGSLRMTLRDQFGAAVPNASVQVSGPSIATAISNAAGELLVTNLVPGDYGARIESAAHFVHLLRFSVEKRQQTVMEVALIRKPVVSDVQVQGQEIRLSKLKFEKDSAALAPDAAESLAELADYMLRDPATHRVRIQGDGGDTLALTRALAIKQRLVDAGVPDARIEAVAEPAKKVTITVVP